MEFNAAKFRDDMQTALDLLESHGVSPPQFFVRRSTFDALRTGLLEIGYTKEETDVYLNIGGITCFAWVETLQ